MTGRLGAVALRHFVGVGPPAIALIRLAADRYAGFGENSIHQPAGEIVPATSLHEAGGSKAKHLLQLWPFFGEGWYIAVF